MKILSDLGIGLQEQKSSGASPVITSNGMPYASSHSWRCHVDRNTMYLHVEQNKVIIRSHDYKRICYTSLQKSSKKI